MVLVKSAGEVGGGTAGAWRRRATPSSVVMAPDSHIRERTMCEAAQAAASATCRRKSDMETPGPDKNATPSQLIDARIEELGDWRGEMLSRLRGLVKRADPAVVEEWKWRGVPVWYHDGMVCTGETYKSIVKVTFAKGAWLEDPSGLFNSGLDGNARRAIDIQEGDSIDEVAFGALVREAVSLNESSSGAKK
jgi:hypothetical protein